VSAAIEETTRAEPRRHRLRRPSQAVVLPILTLLLILAAWELVTRLGNIPKFTLPPMSDVVKTSISHHATLIPAALVTTREALIGFALSVVIGVPLAILITSARWVQNSLYPLLVTTQVIPKVALAPLFVVWFGFGWFPKALLVFLLAFFPIVINSVIGLRSVETEKLYLARSMGATRRQTFWRISLPHAMPNIFGGLKLASTLCVVGAVVAEFVGADAGLGYLIQQANATLDAQTLFAGIVYLSLIGYLLFGLVELAERIALPWHVSRRPTTGA
jgi:NitT/TauT family transport system permease protein